MNNMIPSFRKTRLDLKICIVGVSGTGKTSLCNRWIYNSFNACYKPTVLSDFSFKIIEYKDYTYKIQLWDIGGQDKNIYTSKVFTKNAHAIFYVCDIASDETLHKLKDWKDAVDENARFLDCDSALPSYIFQNKIDLLDDEKCSEKLTMLNKFKQEKGFTECAQVSCKTGKNINEAFDEFLFDIIDKVEEHYKKNKIDIDDRNKTSIIQQVTESNTGPIFLESDNDYLQKIFKCCKI